MKLIKGIVLWVTIFSCLLYISAIDSLNMTTVFGWLLVNIVLICICRYSISGEELEILSGKRFIDSLLSKLKL